MADDEKVSTQVVECSRVEDYEIDECEICEAPVLRLLTAPPRAEAVCSQCLPDVLAAAEKVRRHKIMQDGTIVEGAN